MGVAIGFDWWCSHNPTLTRSFPFPGVVPGHGGGIAFRPCHDDGVTLPRVFTICTLLA
jgi:hypothetical protein